MKLSADPQRVAHWLDVLASTPLDPDGPGSDPGLAPVPLLDAAIASVAGLLTGTVGMAADAHGRECIVGAGCRTCHELVEGLSIIQAYDDLCDRLVE